jgi:integrase
MNIRLTTIRNYCRLLAKAGILEQEDLDIILAVKGKSADEGRNIDEHRAALKMKTRKGYKKEEHLSLRTSQVFALKKASQPARKKASNRDHDKLLATRDSLLMGLIFEHALRVGEVTSLDIECFDLDSGQLTFFREKTARNKNERETHTLKKHTRRAAEDYLDLVQSMEHRTIGPLFKGYQGQRITCRAINARVAVLGKEQGIEGRLSPHDARHYWTYDAFRNKTPLDRVVSGGGWRSPEMALRYAKRAGIANEGVNISEEE